jgi:hypothetical protein
MKLDIEDKILDIDALRYRRNIDIEPFYIDSDSSRYRRNIDIEPFFIDIDSSRYRRYVDIEVKNFDIGIYRYRRFSRYRSKFFRYPCTMSKLCASISKVVCFNICAFFAWVAVARARFWTHIAVSTIHCASNVWPVAYASGIASRGRQSRQGQEWRCPCHLQAVLYPARCKARGFPGPQPASTAGPNTIGPREMGSC